MSHNHDALKELNLAREESDFLRRKCKELEYELALVREARRKLELMVSKDSAHREVATAPIKLREIYRKPGA